MYGQVDWKLKLVRVAFQLGRLAPARAGRWAHGLFVTPRGSRGRSKSSLFDGAHEVTLPGLPLPMKLYGFGSGPVALLVHGWESRSEKFSAVIEPLLARGYRVVAVDSHAHGAAPGTQLAFGVACRAMTSLLEALTPDVVIAHSYGAATVVFGLAHRQKAFPVRVVSLAAIVEAKHISETYLRMTHAPSALRPHFYAELEQRWGEPVEYYSMSSFARQLDCEALLVHDVWDPIIPYAQGQALHSAWRGSRLLTTKELGHHRLLKDEAVLSEVIAFATGEGTASARETAS